MAKKIISLNRLMGKPWDYEFKIVFLKLFSENDGDYSKYIDEIKSNNPELLRIKGRLQLAENAIKSSRDAKKDNLDIILFVGNKTNYGNTVLGISSKSEIVGGMRLEFSRGLDKSGYNAKLYQTQIERGIVMEDKRRVLEDLKYDLFSLIAEIKAGKLALKAYKNSVESENEKLAEALQRYRRGRTDTDQLVQFESQLSVAELSIELQRIELARRYHLLSLLRGDLWKTIKRVDYEFINNTSFKPVQ